MRLVIVVYAQYQYLHVPDMPVLYSYSHKVSVRAPDILATTYPSILLVRKKNNSCQACRKQKREYDEDVI